MTTVTAQNNLENSSYTIDDAVNKIFTKLDEAIDDFENGRVLSEEEVWKQIDLI